LHPSGLVVGVDPSRSLDGCLLTLSQPSVKGGVWNDDCIQREQRTRIASSTAGHVVQLTSSSISRNKKFTGNVLLFVPTLENGGA